MSRYAIGVDIGGTYIKLALVDEAGKIYLRSSISTPDDPRPEPAVAKIIEAALRLKEQAETEGYSIEGVGFTIPHFAEGENWIQLQTNNIPSLEGFPMYPPLREALGPSIAMINDLSAAGVAEHMFGKGRDAERMLMMAIGTGISISVITQEGLVQYSWGSCGDAGMIIVDPNGLADCTCGGRGCLESVAGGWAIRKRALREVERGRQTLLADILQQKGDLEAGDVTQAARAGDAVALEIWEQVGFFVGVALTSYLHIYAPTLIVLGGGVAQARELLIDPIRRNMNRLASPWYLRRLTGIEVSELGKDGGAIGCASVILYPGRYLKQRT